jgi:hypothetical protein
MKKFCFYGWSKFWVWAILKFNDAFYLRLKHFFARLRGHSIFEEDGVGDWQKRVSLPLHFFASTFFNYLSAAKQTVVSQTRQLKRTWNRKRKIEFKFRQTEWDEVQLDDFITNDTEKEAYMYTAGKHFQPFLKLSLLGYTMCVLLSLHSNIWQDLKLTRAIALAYYGDLKTLALLSSVGVG